MTQRFLPYVNEYGEPIFCEHADCTSLAVWWDSTHDALWCDTHATPDVVAPVRVQCMECLEWYNSVSVIHGVCVTCRSIMPLLWVDNEVNHEV